MSDGVAAVALAVVFIAAVTWVDRTRKGDFWLTALPGYVTGAGTLALAFVAYQTMSQERAAREELQQAAERDRKRAVELERQRDIERELRERRSQAELVNVIPIEPQPGISGAQTGSRSFTAGVVNWSDYPISDLRVFLGFRPPEALVGGHPPTLPAPPAWLVAGRSWPIEFQATLYAQYIDGREHLETELWVLFTDANGRRWVRDPRHQLGEATPEYERQLEDAEQRGMLDAPYLATFTPPGGGAGDKGRRR